jgi:hypothetical protein
MVLLLAVLGGAALGAWGARRNGTRFTDERLLWTLGGAMGAVAAIATGAWIAGAGVALGSWAAGSLLVSFLTPALDAGGSRRAWLASASLKALRCPLSTLLGLLAATFAGTSRFELRQGTWFAAVGEGRWALTLGAMVLAQRGMLDGQERVPEAIARHESYHARNAACLGEGGFYLAYVTLGTLRAWFCGAPWNGLARDGRGNPFERTAHALGREMDDPRLG